VTLISDEPSEPYERPPLSKAVLLGKARVADAPIAGPKGMAGHGRSGVAGGLAGELAGRLRRISRRYRVPTTRDVVICLERNRGADHGMGHVTRDSPP
jgi:hypothetical protein